MVQTILSALAPIVFTLLLGFVAAWRHDFGPKEASVLNRMVLLYAVPLALFVGTVGTPRADLVQDIALVVAIFMAIVGLYALVFLLFRFVFRFSLSESVLAALTASAPAVPFMGPAILGDLFGKASAVTIAIAALIINLIVVPITILGLALGRTPIVTTAPPTTRHSAFAEKLVETVKEPIVWAPVLAFVLVLCNVRIPSIADHGLSLLGQATWRRRAVRFRHHACRLQNQNRFDSIIVGVVEEHRSACAGPGWPALTRLRRPHRPRGGADDGHPSYADRDRACRPIPRAGRRAPPLRYFSA